MNYQKIKPINSESVYIDFDLKRTKCKNCKQMIRFGLLDNGKFLPIIEEPDGFYYHTGCKPKEMSDFYNNLELEGGDLV